MKAEIDKVRQQLLAKREANKDAEKPKSAELKKIEAEIDKMLSNPHETKDQVREDIKKGDALLDDLKKAGQRTSRTSQSAKGAIAATGAHSKERRSNQEQGRPGERHEEGARRRRLGERPRKKPTNWPRSCKTRKRPTNCARS